jgi:hypothetical protein
MCQVKANKRCQRKGKQILILLGYSRGCDHVNVKNPANFLSSGLRKITTHVAELNSYASYQDYNDFPDSDAQSLLEL